MRQGQACGAACVDVANNLDASGFRQKLEGNLGRGFGEEKQKELLKQTNHVDDKHSMWCSICTELKAHAHL